MGPYEVVTAFDNGSVKIKTIDISEVSFIVNGLDLGYIINQHLDKISHKMFCNKMKWN